LVFQGGEVPFKKGLEAALVTVVVVALVASIAFALAGVVPSPWYVVESSSMEPVLHVGDLVIALPVDPHEISCGPRGDVIIYRAADGKLIIHRAVDCIEVGGKRFFLTKGDNNNFYDQDPLNPSTWLLEDRVVARMVFSIPILGYPFLERYKVYTQAALLIALAYVLYSSLTSRSKEGGKGKSS